MAGESSVDAIAAAGREAYRDGYSDGGHLAAAHLADVRDGKDAPLSEVVERLAKMWSRADRLKRRKRSFVFGFVEKLYVNGLIDGFCDVYGHRDGHDAGLAMAASLRVAAPSRRFKLI
jgi:hypothetical protein